MKYVVVSGGVVSGLGKGITSSSLGAILKASGLRVTHIKIDPYINIDAGVLSPYEHGEVFVLDDGGEADLDLGNYERFCGIRLTRDHNITTGKIYQQVIARERKGDYLGKTVQVVPHITDAVQGWIERVAAIPVDPGSNLPPEVCIVELGGTVGDIESMVFLEALRQFRYRVGSDNFCHLHVSLVPAVGGEGEQKSKPTQHSIRELRAAGLSADIMICRSARPLDRGTIGKLSLFCMVPSTHVVSVHDVKNLYQVPVLLLNQRVPAMVLNCLRINVMPPERLTAWERLSDRIDSPEKAVTIGIVGKYTGLSDSYLSITKACTHAAIGANLKLNIVWIESMLLEVSEQQKDPAKHAEAWKLLKSVDGVLVPGGFGDRGVEGKILAVEYARTNKIPFLGICLGMQVAVIEYCRNVLRLSRAHSSEFEPDSPHQVVIFMPEISTTQMGGTMRLGSRASKLSSGTISSYLYKSTLINARHRHRYEVNPEYVDQVTAAGLHFSGKDAERGVRMECVELPTDTHPFFWGCQFHPEYTSSPFDASPPFRGLIETAGGVLDLKIAMSQSNASNSPTGSPRES